MNIFTAMRRHIKNILIPHEGNDHCPDLVRPIGVAVLAFLVLAAFVFSITRGLFLNGSGDFTASVLPAVLVALANDDRADESLPELTVNPILEEAARMKAEHMAEHGYFAHKSPDGLDPWYWIYRAGYDFVDAGENLAVNFSDSKDVERAWMDSPGHRANIMNGVFTEVGIAAVPGTYKGKKTVFVVQMFGRPAASVAASSFAVAPTAPATVVPTVSPAVAGATTIEKTDLTARVEGAVPASQEELATVVARENIRGAAVSTWDVARAHPRAFVSWIYVAASLLVAFALLAMVFMQVHRHHARSVSYGVALLVLICFLSYLNWLLMSSELVIA